MVGLMRRTIEVETFNELYPRDNGKIFEITEMSSDKAERWGVRALQGYIERDGAVPDDAALCLAALAGKDIVAVLASVAASLCDELLDEMMACIKNIPDGGKPQSIANGNASQIEEWYTRIYLRSKWIELHTGFSLADTL
jgi:hypothetical protein